MNERICGTETEYGCLIETDGLARDVTPDVMALVVKDHLFERHRVGLLDLHFRDWGEPQGNGGFLFNGGRLYIDMGHVEYATPECASIRDVIAYERAADHLILSALDDLGLREEVSFIRNNIDHATGATFGYHENYLMRRDVPFGKVVIPALLPFLVTRQIFAGSGRVGYHEMEEDYEDPRLRRRRFATRVSDDLPFQISQRSDHIVTEAYQWIQFSRAIINTRDEPLADGNRFRRVHLLVGDANMSEYASALKVGTMHLVLTLIEMGHIPPFLPIANPVSALKTISRDQTFRWLVPLETGRVVSAVEIQGIYLSYAERYLKGVTSDFDWVIKEWRDTLEALASDPSVLRDRLDWVAKKWLLETFVEEEGLEWNDPWLQSIDLEYHKIDPSKSLYHDLSAQGLMKRVVSDRAIDQATTEPPPDTRAKGRSLAMRALLPFDRYYEVDWDYLRVENAAMMEMLDPFQTYESAAGQLDQILQSLPETRVVEPREDE